jgi:hypothetical protein
MSDVDFSISICMIPPDDLLLNVDGRLLESL